MKFVRDGPRGVLEILGRGILGWKSSRGGNGEGYFEEEEEEEELGKKGLEIFKPSSTI